MTGFTAVQRRQVMDRDMHQCQLCGKRAEVVHHRANRGSGGRKSANVLSNAAALCTVCNVLAESDSDHAARARRFGVKISTFARPENEPMRHLTYGWVLLTDTGSVVITHGREEH